MNPFKHRRNSLQQRINATASRLHHRRQALLDRSSEVSQRFNKQLATTETMMLAGGAGFLLGELQLLRPVSPPAAENATGAQTLAWAPNIGLLLKISLEAVTWAHDFFVSASASPESPPSTEAHTQTAADAGPEASDDTHPANH